MCGGRFGALLCHNTPLWLPHKLHWLHWLLATTLATEHNPAGAVVGDQHQQGTVLHGTVGVQLGAWLAPQRTTAPAQQPS
jgi:hypothetical protein